MTYIDELQKAYDEANVAELALDFDDVMVLRDMFDGLLTSMFLNKSMAVIHFTLSKEKVASHKNSKIKMFRLKSCFQCSTNSPKKGGYTIDVAEETKVVDKLEKIIENLIGE